MIYDALKCKSAELRHEEIKEMLESLKTINFHYAVGKERSKMEKYIKMLSDLYLKFSSHLMKSSIYLR